MGGHRRQDGLAPSEAEKAAEHRLMGLLYRLPSDMRHEWHGLADLPGELRIRCVAVERTLIDALVNCDAAKEAEGDEEGPFGDGLEPHALTIGGDIFGFGRYAVRGAVNAAQAAI